MAPDGSFWLVASSGLDHADANGTATYFSLPLFNGAAPSPQRIAYGPDGNLWITEYVGKRILRVNPSDPSILASFPLPTAGVTPGDIIVGPDGNLWFTESVDKIARITIAGQITEYTTPTPSSEPAFIAVGSDGNLWFTESGFHPSNGQFKYNIGRITPAGVITEFEIPTRNSFPQGIAAGSDGNIWFVERGANQIGRITTAGAITEFPIPSEGAELSHMASGPDGRIWFAEDNYARLGRVNPSAPEEIEEVQIPTERVEVAGFVTGLDGNLWFSEFYPRNYLGRVNLVPPVPFTGNFGTADHGGGFASLITITNNETTAGAPRGSSIVVAFSSGGANPGGPVGSCTDTQGNAYAVDVNVPSASNSRALAICSSHDIKALTAADTITVHFPTNGNGQHATANVFTGLAPADTLDRTHIASGNGNAPNSGNTAMTSQADELLIGAFAFNGTNFNRFSAASGYILTNSSQGASANTGLGCEYRIVTSTGQYSANGSLTAGTVWVAGIATYRITAVDP